MTTPGRATLGADVSVALLLVAIAAALFWPVLSIRPLENDNLYALAWVEGATLGTIAAGDPAIAPEWRPLAYLTLWLAHHGLGLDGVPAHHGFNVLLWVGCAWLVHRIVHALSGSRTAGLIAGVFLLTDPRVTWSLVVIIERQSTMACLFGLLALAVVVGAGDERLGRHRAWSIAGLLLASALSKEYGLAFALALLAAAAWRRRADLGWPAGSAIAIYAILRIAVAGGGLGPYCEEQYLLFERRQLCLSMSTESALQIGYNIAATTVNFAFQGFLSEEGQPVFARQRLLTSAFLLLPLSIGLVKGIRLSQVLALIVLANSVLNFMIYRDRNQLVGACAVAILVGIGLAAGRRLIVGRATTAAAAAVIVGLLGLQSNLVRRVVAQEASDVDHSEPCESIIRDRPYIRSFTATIKLHYGLADPYCREHYEP